jgi:hypothetical protein
VRRALKRFVLPYVTLAPTFSFYPNHEYLARGYAFSPACDAEAPFGKTDKLETYGISLLHSASAG